MKVNYNTMSYFLKTGLFTIISFTSFLIPPDNVPGRMTLLITSLLAQANVASNALLKVPDSNQMSNVRIPITLSGIYSLDSYCCILALQVQIYISTCILFVTASLFEYCCIIAMLRFPINHDEEGDPGVMTKEQQINRKRLTRAGLIDMCCIIIFTIFFIHFNVNYFVIVSGQ